MRPREGVGFFRCGGEVVPREALPHVARGMGCHRAAPRGIVDQ